MFIFIQTCQLWDSFHINISSSFHSFKHLAPFLKNRRRYASGLAKYYMQLEDDVQAMGDTFQLENHRKNMSFPIGKDRKTSGNLGFVMEVAGIIELEEWSS